MCAQVQALQDDAAAVRGLLITRFESNAIIGDQLMLHVGKEQLGQQGGGMVSVVNTTSVSAHPVRRGGGTRGRGSHGVSGRARNQHKVDGDHVQLGWLVPLAACVCTALPPGRGA